MVIIIGGVVVLVCVLGGFSMAGGNPASLWHLSEVVTIGGAALGSLIIMSPVKVMKDLVHQIIAALKGSPYNKQAYEELLKALYELFLLGRRNGMIALEEHVMNPKASSIFSKYPGFVGNHHALEFLCNGLKPIIDGKIKPDQLKMLLEVELQSAEDEHHAPLAAQQPELDGGLGGVCRAAPDYF